MLTTKERRPAVRTLRGWAISVLQEAGAIRECEEHGWMQDRADPHAHARAFAIGRREPPPGVPGSAGQTWWGHRRNLTKAFIINRACINQAWAESKRCRDFFRWRC